MTLTCALAQLIVVQLAQLNILHFALFAGGGVAVFLTWTAILLSKVGTQGERLAHAAPRAINTNVADVDDDHLWKFGLFYHNPDNPALFVPRRQSWGWTWNFARPGAVVLLALVILLLIGIIAAAWYDDERAVAEPEAAVLAQQMAPRVARILNALDTQDMHVLRTDLDPIMFSDGGETILKNFVTRRLSPYCGRYRGHRLVKVTRARGFLVFYYAADYEKEKGVQVKIVFTAPLTADSRPSGMWYESAGLRRAASAAKTGNGRARQP